MLMLFNLLLQLQYVPGWCFNHLKPVGDTMDLYLELSFRRRQSMWLWVGRRIIWHNVPNLDIIPK